MKTAKLLKILLGLIFCITLNTNSMSSDKDKFLKACIDGDTKTVHDFLTNGFDVNTEFDTTLNSIEFKGITPLGIAIVCRHLDLIRLLLLRNKIDINKICWFKSNISNKFCWFISLSNSVYNNSKEIFNVLIMNKHIKYIEYSLLEASSHNHGTEYIKLLIQLGISPNICLSGCKFRTPLMIAAQHKIFDNVKLLYEKGADINFVNEYGETALDYAYDTFVEDDTQAHKISQFLIERGAISGKYLSNKKDLKNTLEKVLPKNYDDQLLTLITNYTL